MQDRNPYAAPLTNVAAGPLGSEQYSQIRIFSPSGRLGRLRYIGYSFGLSLLILLLMGVAVAMTSSVPSVMLLIVGAGYALLLLVQFLLTIQRAHDMNSTGWLSLIVLIPLVGLVFWLIPGTKGENDYGLQPPPNSAGVILLACLMPLVVVGGGIVAAIAIPAYQDYTIRAQVSEGLNLAAAPKAAVVETFRRYGTPPADRADAGLSADAADTAGQYVDGVDVVGGTVVIAYGANANALIAGSRLAMQPYVMPDESVAWRCGHAAPPAGGVAMDEGARSAGITEIEPRYLPSACRP